MLMVSYLPLMLYITNLRKTLPTPLTHHDIPMEVVDEDRGDHEILLGDDLVEEYQVISEQYRVEKLVLLEPLTDNEINQIQKCLKMITRPTWHWGPLITLGEAAHGKLEAEQWQWSIEFDLPVVFYKLWWLNCDTDVQKAHQKKLVHSTMLLAMEIKWGMSHITSENHVRQCTKYMQAYLECVKEIFLYITWRPNHHAVLHIHEFLLRYGPIHGCWMFPFKWIIGTLQKTRTNNKMGQWLYTYFRLERKLTKL